MKEKMLENNYSFAEKKVELRDKLCLRCENNIPAKRILFCSTKCRDVKRSGKDRVLYQMSKRGLDKYKENIFKVFSTLH